MHERVAIIGGGPAGSTTAALLARAGRSVVLFDAGERPDLIVGESLLPTVVPVLRELGVEAEVRSEAVYKPGATLVDAVAGHHSFPFVAAEGELDDYAFHVCRPAFDDTLLRAAERAGATLLRQRARVRAEAGGLALDGATEDAARAVLGDSPDLIVDASGRCRVAERALRLDAVAGRRRDVALFAHLDRADLPDEGHIHVDRLSRGWSWRIPLPGRVSVGVVVGACHLPGNDRSVEQVFDDFVDADPIVGSYASGGRRITPVARYTNYQRHVTRLHGPGWALVGDAAGFLDPVFSTGVHLALTGARSLSAAVLSDEPGALGAYESEWLAELGRWRRIIDTWYDGRLLALLRSGTFLSRHAPGGPLVHGHVARHVTRVFTGEAGAETYSAKLLSFMLPFGRLGEAEFAIR